jgi:DNA-directed RNA polymerase alpha subunit
LNNRTKYAVELRQQGLSFNLICQDLGIGSERAEQIVRKYEAYLEPLEDPLKRKIEELNRPGNAKRILNALRGRDCYDGDPMKLANCKPEEIRKINGLGTKSVAVIAQALESLGVIVDEEEWLRG